MRLAAILLMLIPLLSRADLEEGRSIYETGRLADGSMVPAYLGDIPSPRPIACTNCHRKSGLGTSESGKTIPPVAWSTLDKEEAFDFDYGHFRFLRKNRRPYDNRLFHRALTTGVNSSGQLLKETMPRYALSREQGDSLVEYLKTLFVRHSPGVDERQLKIALVVDRRLPEEQVRQHLVFLDGLLKMKNSESRKEELRKRFAPVQKIPQYLSYRKWKFIVWELPEDGGQWRESLSARYQREPVFALLAPLVRDNYRTIGDFCESEKLPCLFPPNARGSSGSYYSFLYRDWAKRARQYVSSQSVRGAQVFRVESQTGEILPLDATREPGRIADRSVLGRFIERYVDFCTTQATILMQLSPELLPELDQVSCPGVARARLKLLLPEDAGYRDFVSASGLAERSDALCVVSDFDRPGRFSVRKVRVQVMARRFGIKEPDEELLSKDLFAFGVVSDAIHKLNGAFSRQYMLEIIEHMLNTFPNYTYFAETSGAPYQREVAGAFNEYCGEEAT